MNITIPNRFLILSIVGPLIASLSNFCIFIIFPLAFDDSGMGSFIKSNYLGGLYLFGVASSTTPVTLLAFKQKNFTFIFVYFFLSLLLIVLLPVFEYSFNLGISFGLKTYICLFSALFLQYTSFVLAKLVILERARDILTLVIIQPLSFLIILLINIIFNFEIDWAFIYFFSCMASVYFAQQLNSDLRPIFFGYTSSIKSVLAKLIAVMIGGVGISLFLQIEQIFVGRVLYLDIEKFVIFQKIYSSIPIALLTIYGSYLVKKALQINLTFTESFNLIIVGIFVFCFSLIFQFFLITIFPGYKLLSDMIFFISICSAIFSVVNIIFMRHVIFKPLQTSIICLISQIIYFFILFVFRPDTFEMVISCTSLFFLILGILLLVVNYQYNKNNENSYSNV